MAIAFGTLEPGLAEEPTTIEFDADGVLLRGLFFPAAGDDGQAPCVVMAHGWAGEVSHFLPDFARVFSAAGIASVVFDYRGWGNSDVAPGKPRNESDPWEQIRDYQHAISYAQNRPDVDSERIGVWGFSYSAGHAFVVGAIDRRVKAVVGQAPVISGRRNFQGLVRVDLEAATHREFEADRRARAAGESPAVIPVVAEDPSQPAALPAVDAYEYFCGPGGVIERDPGFANEITVRSIEYLYGYEPGRYVPRITPTPLLMIVARQDSLAPSDVALHAYESAAQPKHLVTIDGGHFDVIRGPAAQVAQAAARDWFAEHLQHVSIAAPSVR
jgi:dienelactone hydrolase